MITEKAVGLGIGGDREGGKLNKILKKRGGGARRQYSGDLHKIE